MSRLPHLFPRDTALSERYKSTRSGGGEFQTPPRDTRSRHGADLLGQLSTAASEAESRFADAEESDVLCAPFEFVSDPGFRLRLESLEQERKGIHLLNVRIEDDVMRATVRVPFDQFKHFENVLRQYMTEAAPKGGPRHRRLVESISGLRLAAVRAYWTDSPSLYPEERAVIWWEVWLCSGAGVQDRFRAAAQNAGLHLLDQWIEFPERLVVLARGTAMQLSELLGKSDDLAELRLAKLIPTAFLQLPPKEQAQLVANVLSRIDQTETRAAVCLLDTGVNASHPLLSVAASPEAIQSVNPAWSSADLNGHGTEMAGLALYGCLTEVVGHERRVELRHRIESVKILPDVGQNEPQMYGAVTAEASARAEVGAPDVDRVFCLAVTADSRDDGLPSSWSAELDQLAVGVPDSVSRLFIVSAGNVETSSRHEYPQINQIRGVQDPSQAWNVVTAGAFTERVFISSRDFAGWRPLASHGRLSPCSTTSLIWPDKSWPLKPDIVMEGGNSAIEPGAGGADFIDDLALLTTRVSPTGALLAATGETSAAAAQAARFAAIIRSHYPRLWPEAVRGLLIHSAEWTPEMLREFPFAQREQRLRCYGYGVPRLQSALWSAGNAATLLVQSELQPFDRIEGKVATKEMHLHGIPWPAAVLQSLGEQPVTMRITLSYFIEPSPGRAGWGRKHRYQSHGLRFEVQRPTETSDQLRQRVTRTAWEDDGRPPSSREERNWELGANLRTRGSVHSDQWSGTASELANCNHIAVYPITGWWLERPHLHRWSRSVRYAMIVTIKSAETKVDLYTPIRAQIDLVSEIEV